MKIKLIIYYLILLFLLPIGEVLAQRVDTIDVFSRKMNKNVKNLVIVPKNYDSGKEYPVIYLLHGYGGNQNTWLNIKKTLPEESSKRDIIIVCPDGKNSWYWDSPIDSSSMYETYITQELVPFIDQKYNTVSTSHGRAISGFSMGGHGGLWLAIRHPNLFGACGSMSGGVDIRPFPNSWEMRNLLGTYKNNSKVWDSHTVINEIDKLKPNTLSIVIDCGKDDFFFQVNEEFHKKLDKMGIKHEYIISQGAHTFQYWNKAIDYQLDFFNQYFESNHVLPNK